MVRPGNDREKAAPEPVAVDHDIEGQENGAEGVGGECKGFHGVGESRGSSRADGTSVFKIAQPFRQGFAEGITGKLVRQLGP